MPRGCLSSAGAGEAPSRPEPLGGARIRSRGVALWAPVSIPASTMAYYLGQDYICAGLGSGGRAVKAKLPEGGFIWLKTPFFEDLFAFDPVAELERYPGQIFVAVGTKSTDVNPQPEMGQILFAYQKGPGELCCGSIQWTTSSTCSRMPTPSTPKSRPLRRSWRNT